MYNGRMSETTESTVPEEKKLFKVDRNKLALLIFAGFVTGVVWFIAMRVILYTPRSPHFHANFAVVINGKKETFQEPTFYEEVSSCGEIDDNPLTRVHMHDQIGDVVHVHDGSATWGNFFENLGFALGDNVLYARNKSYVDGQNGELHFILNGKSVVSIANKTIKSEDKLLVSFDKPSADFETQYAEVATSAAEYNRTADPSACKGSDDGKFMSRLRDALGIR